MDCQSCARALDADARFCPACGTPVVPACAACGAALDADARFCKRCGLAVESAPRSQPPAAQPSIDRERKVATLLFADIVGFTELGERLDAEVVSRLVTEAFERLSAEIGRYGGTVEKFAGDAMLAVFGVPTTHEDDPERAVRAALEMQSAIARPDGERLRLRIGIESGEVLADLARSTTDRDLFVTGDAVNTASRLQVAAEPGTVVVGPSTYASTRGLIEYEELPARALKGKELPIASWRAIRVRARRGGRRAPLGIEAPLIGRDEELTLLKETIRRTVSTGRPHLVTVSGEAGVGKTRLIWELEKYLDGLPDTFHWRKGRCYSYASASYAPLVEAVKADAGISDDDPPQVMDQKLAARLEVLAVGTELPVRAAVRALLGLAGDARLAQDELFESWRLYLAAIASLYPLVLVAEDVHWADDATLDFLEFIARWGEAPIVVLCVARPELLERRPTWGGGIRNASLVEIDPLEALESAALIDELLDGALPDELRSRVVDMAHGNPLFTEELVRMFIDQGVLQSRDGAWRLVGPVTELAVPGSVQAVLSARLDELDIEEKRIAQEAAVVGRIFWDVIVAHLRDRSAEEVADALRGMRVKELVAPRVPSAMAGASEWSFHHVLVRDVAYESLPKADRAALHLQVAHWAETELADRIGEFAELVASHTAAALDYEQELRSSGDEPPGLQALRQETLAAAERAARRAGALQDRQAARRWQLLAIEQARRLDKPAIERARLAQLFFELTGHELGAAERVDLFTEASEALEPIAMADAETRELWGRLRAALGFAVYEAGQQDEAHEILEAAAATLAPYSPSAARAKALQQLSWSRWHSFQFDAAEAAALAAMDEATAAEADDVYRWAVHELGVVSAFKGQPATGLERLQESYELATDAEDRDLLARCYINLSSILLNSGYPLDKPAEMLELATTMARRSASYATLSFVGDNYAGLSYLRGDFEDSLERADEAKDACARAGLQSFDSTIHRARFDALSALGRDEEAARELAAANELEGDDPQHRDYLLVAQARATFRADPDAAVQHLRGPHAQLEGYPNAELTVAVWLARIAYRTGDTAAFDEARQVQARHGDQGGIGRRLEARWTAALAEEDVAALEAVARAFEEDVGNRLYAAEALVDAALVEARTGSDTGALGRAQASARGISLHPLLGPLPEARWLGAGAVSAG